MKFLNDGRRRNLRGLRRLVPVSILRAGTMVIGLSMALISCTQQKTSAAPPEQQPVVTSKAAKVGSPRRGPLPQISGTRAYQYTKEIVAFGPRYVSSPGHKRTEDHIRAKLNGATLEEDRFTANTPAGKFPMTNLIAKFQGTKDGIIVLAGHYDTLYNRKDFVGANDGGSSAGLLLELSDQLRSQMKNGRREGYSIWLVWLDGEEAFRNWTDTDSTYGSRHLAEQWHKDGIDRKIKAFLLADMIGDADLNIERDLNSSPWLEDLIFQAATSYGYQSHFFRRQVAMSDDHNAFAVLGIPVADLIDFDYGYDNSFWHTSDDTMDKLSPKSFEIVGNVMLETVRFLDEK